MLLLQAFSLNLITFYFSFHDSAGVLFNMEIMDSLIDSVQFAGFNLSNIKEQVVDYESYESEDISDIRVSSVHTLDISDLEQSYSDLDYFLTIILLLPWVIHFW